MKPLSKRRAVLRFLDRLVRKAIVAEEELKGLRQGKVIGDVFERLGYMTAESFTITNYPRRPVVAFNPSAVASGDDLYLFVRFIFDYYDYVSSVGVSTVKLEAIDELPKMRLKSEITIYPTTKDEIKRGAEDPRAHPFEEGFLVFYTAVGLKDGDLWPKQGVAILNNDMKVVKKDVLKITHDGKYYIPPAWKNTIMLTDKGHKIRILTRPLLEGHEVIWRADADKGSWGVDPESMDVVMVPESNEIKVGISTPPVKIGSDEYLVGWHAIMKDDLSYRNGLAVFSGDGELLGITEYMLVPTTIEELYGDRPMVIYGCGLVRKDEYVYWLGGIADYGIGVYRAELDKVLEHVKWLRG